MAENYSTAVERIRARLVARGMPPDKALNNAEKQASAKRKIANPGQKGRKTNKRYNFKKGTDPVPPKEKKPSMRKEDITAFAKNMVMEIHGITGLIGSGGAGPGGGPVGLGGSDPGSPEPSTTSKQLSTKYKQDNESDPTDKKGSKGGTSTGFKKGGGPHAKVSRAKPGQTTLSPPTMEDIEAEFGIV